MMYQHHTMSGWSAAMLAGAPLLPIPTAVVPSGLFCQRCAGDGLVRCPDPECWLCAMDEPCPHAEPCGCGFPPATYLAPSAAAREGLRMRAELALLRRVAAEARWAGLLWQPWAPWPPRWLTEMVEQGRADALQADRAKVLGHSVDPVEGLDQWGAPLVPSTGRRWFTHRAPPRQPDPDGYEAARRALAACTGREVGR